MFAVVFKPGFRSHVMQVQSTHMTISAAEKAAKKKAYTNERGERVEPCEVVEPTCPTAKGWSLFDDATGRQGWRRV